MVSFGFDIKNSEDFYHKLQDDFSDLLKDTLSSRIAINSAMTAWHLTEWVYHEYFATVFKNEVELQVKIKSVCPSFQIMQDISNGTKHSVLKRHKPEIEDTGVHDGDFNPADFNDDFDVSRLIVIKKDGTVLNFLDELEIVINYWEKFFSRSTKIL